MNQSNRNKTDEIVNEDVRVKMHDYMVHFRRDKNTIFFDAYPIEGWIDSKTGKTGFCYLDKEDVLDVHYEFIENKCWKPLSGSCNWSDGGWDDRVTVCNDLITGRTLIEIARLYEKDIFPWIRTRLAGTISRLQT